MNLAIFGGSFDPPHNAHIEIVEFLLKQSYIDQLIILVAYLNPFKRVYRFQASKRLEWLKKIFKNNTKVLCSDYEILQGKSTPSIQSVRYFQKYYSPERIFFVIGADNLFLLPQWQEFEALKNMVEFLVFQREICDCEYNKELQAIQHKYKEQCVQCSESSLQNSLHKDSDKYYDFANKHGIIMQYFYFNQHISSTHIMQNINMYLQNIPKEIRDEVMNNFKANSH
ncbi:nicotinate (nicotinamide) nucleotide adenylyltransferase [Helicobacter didelphidarum]|uniref:Probable nicotinate-nucleotide adenylyltransferase n=1 Tax=Helicobacter didelphidarum TaxID=2040648 RepID=A0A3D8IPQ5_9HELI|nr:nicotinate (nicotinamide) nucleotide adenylyltransferase [Helicobacter didelphidarum]RDU66970.1 nicotinate (nicotinamide) nucleotide adenylyltransferase [Helicobacter didelphidarum]